MTIKDLSQYHILKLEIEQIKSSLEELAKTSVGSPNFTGLPSSKGTTSNLVETTVLKREKLYKSLVKKESSLIDELKKIEDFLKMVDDGVIRVIIRERFINGAKWSDIAKMLNFERTSPYYRLKKYLGAVNEKNKENWCI